MTQKVTIPKGVDCEFEIPNVRSKSGALIDPNGVSVVQAQLRTVIDPFLLPNPVYEWSLAAGTVSVETGKVLLHVDGTISTNWSLSTGWVDVKVVDTAGDIGSVGPVFLVLGPEYTKLS